MRRGIHIMAIYEVLEAAAKLKTKKEKVQFLKDNDSLALRDILKIGIDKSIKCLFPPGPPPYTPAESEPYRDIEKITRKWAQWCTWQGKPNDNVPMVKRESSFIAALESVHPQEAELMLRAKDKALILPNGTAFYKGVTKKVVEEAFPNLIVK